MSFIALPIEASEIEEHIVGGEWEKGRVTKKREYEGRKK